LRGAFLICFLEKASHSIVMEKLAYKLICKRQARHFCLAQGLLKKTLGYTGDLTCDAF
jgi:hypothetical protein